MKTYGNTNTHLTMSYKAMEVYSNTDPLTIEEIETDDGFRYNMTGAVERRCLTEDQVNDVLESLDETHIATGYTPDHKRFDLILRDGHLYINTADSDQLFNDEYYENEDDYGIRSVIDGLISDGYNLTTNY